MFMVKQNNKIKPNVQKDIKAKGNNSSSLC